VAIKKHHISKPARSPRRPGESANEWTVRTAYLWQKPTGRWVIKHTDIIVNDTTGATTYRTNEQACFTPDRTEAENAFTEWRQHRLTPKHSTRTRCTFRDVVDAYKTTRTKRFSGTNDYKARQLCDWLGDDPVDAIQERRLDELHAILTAEGFAPGTVRNFMSVLLTMLRYAERNGMAPKNSVPTYKMPPPSPPRPHALTQAQDDMAFTTAAAWSRDKDPLKRRTGLFVCLALDTAQRREAILGLTWERVNLKTDLIDFTDPKHAPKNKVRCDAMPIMPRLWDVLTDAARIAARNQNGEPVGRVFPTHRITEGFARFRDATGLPDWFTPHVCRHTWVTLAMGTQMPLETISKLTGDSVPTLQKTYTHVHTDTHRENLRRFLYHVQIRHPASRKETPEHVATKSRD